MAASSSYVGSASIAPAAPASDSRLAKNGGAAVRRVAYNTTETAAMLGISEDALRRRAARASRRAPDGGVIAELDLGIVGRKRGSRWFYTIPRQLLDDDE